MKTVTGTILCVLLFYITKAQTKTSDIIEGGKALVELISVLKKGKVEGPSSLIAGKTRIDSCAVKQQSDLCFKNSTAKDLVISIYKRNDGGYEIQPFTVKVIAKKQECLYELHSGIYKYRIEVDSGGVKTLLNEGEMKLQPCDNMQREITE